jgi:O-antigen/teichoic acid export membrane protein
MLMLVSFRAWGLLIAFALGLVLTTVIGSVSLGRQTGGKRVNFRSFRLLRRYLSLTSGNYLATIFGMLPLGVVPILVLVILGATAAGRFAVAFLIAGFLNIIPSTVAQVLFAEASREEGSLREQLRKAIRGVYGLLLPPLIIVVVAAPLLLHIFGAAYAAAATGCLRVLALSALLTGGTYLIDSLLIAQDRVAAYVFMNGVNAALVLGLVGGLLPRGLTAGAVGWALAQGLSLLIGQVVLATGRSGRHRRAAEAAPAGQAPQYPEPDLQPPPLFAPEPQIWELPVAGPVLPTTIGVAQAAPDGQQQDEQQRRPSDPDQGNDQHSHQRR